MFLLRPSRLEDIEDLAPRLRAIVVDEMRIVTRKTPAQVLRIGFDTSRPCLTVVGDDRPLAMFGVVPDPEPDTGTLWLLPSDDLFRHPVALLRRCRPVVAELARQYPRLKAMTDARHDLRWIEWCGFSRTQCVPQGREARPFFQLVHKSAEV